MHSKNRVGTQQKFGVGFRELSLFDHFNGNVNNKYRFQQETIDDNCINILVVLI